jgi:hypothetical protein
MKRPQLADNKDGLTVREHASADLAARTANPSTSFDVPAFGNPHN